jgi:hypothetical protein
VNASAMSEAVAFKTAKEAFDTGFADGAKDRSDGHTSEKDAREQREPLQVEAWSRLAFL